jgi:AraC family transcriptional activator of pobA
MATLLHSIDSFGILKVSLSSIRIEKLEDRIKPRVPFPHRHDFFQIILITAGSGEHQIDFNRHKVVSNQIFIMKPGQMHSWELSKGVKGYVVEFSHQSLNLSTANSELINQFSLSPDVHHFRHKHDFIMLIKLTEIMITEFKAQREMHDLCLQGYLLSFVIQIIRSDERRVKQEKIITIIENFKQLLENNFKEAHSVGFYSQRLGVSSKALTMQLSRSIGKPPRVLIQERILLESKRYLAFSGLSIADIGYKLGFEDANYFTRFFRLHEKQTPAQFRKKINVEHGNV